MSLLRYIVGLENVNLLKTNCLNIENFSHDH